MHEIEKLLKISQSERNDHLVIIDSLDIKNERKRLQPIKLKGSNVYRIRVGRFRIIFHMENGVATTDAVRLRNEKTDKF